MATITFFGILDLDEDNEVSVTLNPTFAYQVRHTGVDASGTDDANSAKTAWLSYTSGGTEYPLMDGQSVEVGPGITTLYAESVIGADGRLAFSRKGELTRAW